MIEAAPLAARVEDLRQADQAIADAARGGNIAVLIEAIEARAPVAAAVLETISLEDRDLSFRMAAAAVRPGGGVRFAERFMRRDQEMEHLAHLVDSRTRRYNRLLRQLEDERSPPAGGRWAATDHSPDSDQARKSAGR